MEKSLEKMGTRRNLVGLKRDLKEIEINIDSIIKDLRNFINFKESSTFSAAFKPIRSVDLAIKAKSTVLNLIHKMQSHANPDVNLLIREMYEGENYSRILSENLSAAISQLEESEKNLYSK